MLMSPQEMREAIIEEKRLHVESSVVSMVSKMMTELKFESETTILCDSVKEAHKAKEQAINLLTQVAEKGWIVKARIIDYLTETGRIKYALNISIKDK